MKTRDERISDDFQFMVLCAAKGCMGLYDLLRDRTLDGPEPPTPGEIEYLSWVPYGVPASPNDQQEQQR